MLTALGTRTAIEVELRRLMEAAGVDGAVIVLSRRTADGLGSVVVGVSRRDRPPIATKEMLQSVALDGAPAER